MSGIVRGLFISQDRIHNDTQFSVANKIDSNVIIPSPAAAQVAWLASVAGQAESSVLIRPASTFS